MKLYKLAVVMLIVSIILIGCEATNVAPRPASDSSQRFATTDSSGKIAAVETDTGVYTISGTVIGDMTSLVRQTSPAFGSFGGSMYAASGTYFGPELGGKGFVRLHVISSDSKYAPKGTNVILKVVDTKAIALLPGDTVEFKCRHQYENVAAVLDNEVFDVEKLATWEIDYCRLSSPIIGQ